MDGLPKLKKLDLNTNKLTHLKSLPRLESIQEIDVATNTITGADNISQLAKYSTLIKFNGAANPMTEELADKFKQEVLFRLYPAVKLRFLGEEEIVDDDIAQWKAERKERIKAQQELDRLAAEKAARGDEEPKEAEEAEPVEEAE